MIWGGFSSKLRQNLVGHPGNGAPGSSFFPPSLLDGVKVVEEISSDEMCNLSFFLVVATRIETTLLITLCSR